MQLTYEKVECLKVKGCAFTLESKWNGLEEWRDSQGRKLIVSRCEQDGMLGVVDRLFDFIPKPQTGMLAVIAGSPDLLAQLKEVG